MRKNNYYFCVCACVCLVAVVFLIGEGTEKSDYPSKGVVQFWGFPGLKASAQGADGSCG